MFGLDPQESPLLLQNGRTATVVAVLMIILGLFAIIHPFFASLVASGVLGFVLLIFGILQLIYGFQTSRKHVGSFIFNTLLGLFYIVAGLITIRNPILSIVNLTLLVGILFFVEGSIQVIHAFEMKPMKNWGWMLASGISGIILGILIWSNWPADSLQILGLLVGINLLTTGLGVLMVSRVSTRRLRNTV